MEIKIINLGGINHDFIKRGVDYYIEKIKYFSKIKLIVPQKKFVYSSKEEKLKKQAEFALRYIDYSSYNIFLDQKGRSYDSNSFACFFEKRLMNFQNINFFIGGDDGFHPDFKKKSNELISLSTFTMNHELVTLILIEVLFRTFSIIRSFPYHR